MIKRKRATAEEKKEDDVDVGLDVEDDAAQKAQKSRGGGGFSGDFGHVPQDCWVMIVLFLSSCLQDCKELMQSSRAVRRACHHAAEHFTRFPTCINSASHAQALPRNLTFLHCFDNFPLPAFPKLRSLTLRGASRRHLRHHLPHPRFIIPDSIVTLRLISCEVVPSLPPQLVELSLVKCGPVESWPTTLRRLRLQRTCMPKNLQDLPCPQLEWCHVEFARGPHSDFFLYYPPPHLRRYEVFDHDSVWFTEGVLMMCMTKIAIEDSLHTLVLGRCKVPPRITLSGNLERLFLHDVTVEYGGGIIELLCHAAPRVAIFCDCCSDLRMIRASDVRLISVCDYRQHRPFPETFEVACDNVGEVDLRQFCHLATVRGTYQKWFSWNPDQFPKLRPQPNEPWID